MCVFFFELLLHYCQWWPSSLRFNIIIIFWTTLCGTYATQPLSSSINHHHRHDNFQVHCDSLIIWSTWSSAIIIITSYYHCYLTLESSACYIVCRYMITSTSFLSSSLFIVIMTIINIATFCLSPSLSATLTSSLLYTVSSSHYHRYHTSNHTYSLIGSRGWHLYCRLRNFRISKTRSMVRRGIENRPAAAVYSPIDHRPSCRLLSNLIFMFLVILLTLLLKRYWAYTTQRLHHETAASQTPWSGRTENRPFFSF